MGASDILRNLVNENISFYLYDNAIFYAERLYYEESIPTNLSLLAQCYIQYGKMKQAYLLLKDSPDSTCRYLFAFVCISLKKYTEAEKALLHDQYTNKVSKVDSKYKVPGGAAGLYLLGLICKKEHRRESAIAYFKASLKEDPTLWSTMTELLELGVTVNVNSLYGLHNITQFSKRKSQHSSYLHGNQQQQHMLYKDQAHSYSQTKYSSTTQSKTSPRYTSSTTLLSTTDDDRISPNTRYTKDNTIKKQYSTAAAVLEGRKLAESPHDSHLSNISPRQQQSQQSQQQQQLNASSSYSMNSSPPVSLSLGTSSMSHRVPYPSPGSIQTPFFMASDLNPSSDSRNMTSNPNLGQGSSPIRDTDMDRQQQQLDNIGHSYSYSPLHHTNATASSANVTTTIATTNPSYVPMSPTLPPSRALFDMSTVHSGATGITPGMKSFTLDEDAYKTTSLAKKPPRNTGVPTTSTYMGANIGTSQSLFSTHEMTPIRGISTEGDMSINHLSTIRGIDQLSTIRGMNQNPLESTMMSNPYTNNTNNYYYIHDTSTTFPDSQLLNNVTDTQSMNRRVSVGPTARLSFSAADGIHNLDKNTIRNTDNTRIVQDNSTHMGDLSAIQTTADCSMTAGGGGNIDDDIYPQKVHRIVPTQTNRIQASQPTELISNNNMCSIKFMMSPILASQDTSTINLHHSEFLQDGPQTTISTTMGGGGGGTNMPDRSHTAVVGGSIQSPSPSHIININSTPNSMNITPIEPYSNDFFNSSSATTGYLNTISKNMNATTTKKENTNPNPFFSIDNTKGLDLPNRLKPEEKRESLSPTTKFLSSHTMRAESTDPKTTVHGDGKIRQDYNMQHYYHPNDIKLLFELLSIFTLAYQQLYQYDSLNCIKTLRTLPSQQYNSGYVYQLIGRAYYELCDYKSALYILKEMIRMEPYRVKGTEILSTVLWHLKKETESCALAQQILELDKFAPEAWCVVGNCFSLQKEHDVAIRYFQRAIQLDPSFTYAHTLYGHELINNEDLDKAMTCFRSALLSDERHYNAWYGLGSIYYRQEKYDLAEYHFRKALSINKNSSILKCFLAIVLHTQGLGTGSNNIDTSAGDDDDIDPQRTRERKTKEAYAILNDAIENDIKNPQLRFQKANILFAIVQYTEMNDTGEDIILNKSSTNVMTIIPHHTCSDLLMLIITELEIVQETTSKEPLVYILLAQANHKLGRTLEAIKYYNMAIALDPKDTAGLKAILETL